MTFEDVIIIIKKLKGMPLTHVFEEMDTEHTHFLLYPEVRWFLKKDQ